MFLGLPKDRRQRGLGSRTTLLFPEAAAETARQSFFTASSLWLLFNCFVSYISVNMFINSVFLHQEHAFPFTSVQLIKGKGHHFEYENYDIFILFDRIICCYWPRNSWGPERSLGLIFASRIENTNWSDCPNKRRQKITNNTFAVVSWRFEANGG